MAMQIVTACATSGCGTILYPERRGQPAGRLDWKVVLLDGLGLIFFFIPGVIAFAVDFLNGTIYLPPSSTYQPPCDPTPVTRGQSEEQPAQLKKIRVARSELTPGRIEQIIAEQTGKSISLDDGDYVTQEMKSIDEFWPLHDSLDTHSLGRPGFVS